MVAEMPGRRRASRCISGLQYHHLHVVSDTAYSIIHTVAPRTLLTASSRERKISRLSSKLLLEILGLVQAWPQCFPEIRAQLSRHACADCKPACKIDCFCSHSCARASAFIMQRSARLQKYILTWSVGHIGVHHPGAKS